MSFALTITPDAQKVYTVDTGSGTITGYRLTPLGTLALIPGSVVSIGAPVYGAAISPDGAFLFVTVGQGTTEVLSYAIAPSGALTPTNAPSIQAGLSYAQPAITPSGRFLIVTDHIGRQVSSFSIGPHARLTRIGTPLPTETGPFNPAFTPDGRYLYLSNEYGQSVSGFAIAADGRLSPTPGSPYGVSGNPHGAAITTDGRRLYVPTAIGRKIYGFHIVSSGELVPLPGSPYAVPGSVISAGRTILSPDGRWLFLVEEFSSHLTSLVDAYAVSADGALTPAALAPTDTAVAYSDGSSAFTTPDQSPVAALRVVGRSHGFTRAFSAAASRAFEGTIVRYDWSFGDGHGEMTTKPTAEHRYTRSGALTVRVTVIDSEGCSTHLVYNGTSAVCNGASRATAARRVVVHRSEAHLWGPHRSP